MQNPNEALRGSCSLSLDGDGAFPSVAHVFLFTSHVVTSSYFLEFSVSLPFIITVEHANINPAGECS